jgi:hypothetical protein
MAKFELSEKKLQFPTKPVLDPINRAKLIAEISGNLLAQFVGATASSDKSNIDPGEFSLVAAALVYNAEELALPPKVPSSS